GVAPLMWGEDLFIPGSDGRAYLVDPRTGEPRAEPFVPPFDRARPTRWRSPVLLDDGALVLADESGRVRRLTKMTDPGPRLVAAAEATLGKELVTDPVSTGQAVALATADGRLRVLAARDLSPVGAVPLEFPLAAPPWAAAGRCLLADVEGNVLAV